MLSIFVSLAVGVIATAVGTVAGNYIYDRWFSSRRR